MWLRTLCYTLCILYIQYFSGALWTDRPLRGVKARSHTAPSPTPYPPPSRSRAKAEGPRGREAEGPRGRGAEGPKRYQATENARNVR